MDRGGSARNESPQAAPEGDRQRIVAWQFEVGKIYVKSAEQIVQALAAH